MADGGLDATGSPDPEADPGPPTRARRSEHRWSPERTFEPQPAVRWFGVGELFNSGLRAGMATSIGTYADRREGFRQPDETCHDHAVRGEDPVEGEYWFDFVADVGDGFSATYSVAEALACDELVTPDRDASGSEGEHWLSVKGLGEVLPRGDLLVMGGDQIYPTPAAGYRTRTLGPYEVALPALEDPARPDEPQLHVYAIPGNHDWYDGLGAFLRHFADGQWMGAWKADQTASYFAIKLPHKWWLWGIDVGLADAVDSQQRRYFERVASDEVADGDQIIVCTSKPSWLGCPAPPGSGSPAAGVSEEGVRTVVDDEAHATLRWFHRQLVRWRSGARIALWLSGDKHFYVRYEAADRGPSTADRATFDAPRVVAGGGGAYLSATHELPRELLLRDADGPEATRYTRARAWPSPGESRRAMAWWRAHFRLWRAWSLALLFAGLYGLAGYLYRLSADDWATDERDDITTGFFGVVEELRDAGPDRLAIEAISHPPFWILSAVLVWVATTLANVKARGFWQHLGGIIWGVLHGGAHVAATLGVTWLAIWVSVGHADWLFLVVVIGAAIVVTIHVDRLQTLFGGGSPRWYQTLGVPIVGGVVVGVTGVGVWSAGPSDAQLATTFLLVQLLGGAIAGMAIFTAYLVLAQLAWVAWIQRWVLQQDDPEPRPRNANELSVAVAHPGWKNFLRFRITPGEGDEAGTLTMWAIGTRKAPRRSLEFLDHPEGGRRARLDQRIGLPARQPEWELIERFRIPPR